MSGGTHTKRNGEKVRPRNRIRAWRRTNGASITDLADLTGLSQAFLTRLENADRGASPATKLRIARALGVPIRELFPAQESSA